MVKCRIYIVFVTIIFIVDAIPKECERCTAIEDCALFRDKSIKEQKSIIEEFACTKSQGSGTTRYVCCPDVNVWGIEGPEKSEVNEKNQYYDHSNNFGEADKPNSKLNVDIKEHSDSDDDEYEQSRIPSRYGNRRRQWSNNNRSRRPQASNNNVPNYNMPVTGIFGNNVNGQQRSFQGNNANGFNGNNIPNSYFPNAQSNSFDQGNLNKQCANLNSYPPSPRSGCCGKDETYASKVMGYRPAQKSNQNWNPSTSYPSNSNSFWTPGNARFKRSEENDTINVTIDSRISGGKETELEQFPWTVLLTTTFDYGDRKQGFNCGGSIISARYVLTAAHCVVEERATVTGVEVHLAEFNKRTFPLDCVNVPGEGKKCIENIITQAEDVTPHPQYDDKKLQNDIALIRLRENAPYTDFIRPICLPPIDIDNPDYYDLRLAVAGWGRDGKFVSQVKQSTVVNLVPQRECSRSYPHLTRRHLCAAGHSGEDTCKGDSGGPLMMLYEGQYYVSGVVSGKRADSPCGTSVPSLYTNVYHYIDWITSNIKN